MHKKFHEFLMKHQDFMIKMVSMVHKGHIQTNPSQIIFPHVHNLIKNAHKKLDEKWRSMQKIPSQLDHPLILYEF